MALSEALATMSAQAKEAEDEFHAAQSSQRAKLEEEITRARTSAEQSRDALRNRADQTKADVSSGWRDLQQQFPGVTLAAASWQDASIKSLARARAIGEAARARVLSEHTYAHRAARLEAVLEQASGSWLLAAGLQKESSQPVADSQ